MKSDDENSLFNVTRREALGLMGMTAAALTAGCVSEGSGRPGPKAIILGFDGMDYRLVSEMLGRGELPNFAKVAGRGSFLPLISSTPPQSPVAWSNFITGKDPGGHGIFDFIARDPKDYMPFLSLSKVTGSEKHIDAFGLEIPLSVGKAELLRKGDSWWEILERNGVPSTVISVPSNFPPVECDQRTISGMGTPDILGTYGTFSFYTSEPEEDAGVQGGKIVHVEVDEGVVEAELQGPSNSLKKEHPDIMLPFTVYVDEAAPQARISIGGHDVILKQGEWSDWLTLSFPLAMGFDVKGIARLYLKEVRPEFKLYVSPVNIDPAHPSVPISTPAKYSGQVTEAIGPHYTQGIPEDTWALNEGRLNEDEYLVQANIAKNERIALFRMELERFTRASAGVYFCYFGTTDTCSHMFWGHRDPNHPVYDPAVSPKYAGVIEGFYRDMDGIVGEALAALPEGTEFIIVSDHGFSPFYRAFHVNRWLLDNGYIGLLDESLGESGEFFENVDWSRTKAYALGLNGLYINLEGREGQGIVPASDRDALVAELAEKLGAVKDPKGGGTVISEAYDTAKIYTGEYKGIAPDMIIGYSSGYRGSWETALGKIPATLLDDNKKKWSGDHCMDAAFVPGIFFSSRKVDRGNMGLEDVAPSLLSLYGIPVPEDMVGKSFI
ncbi:MAG: alkaline phosphatase family protein [Nitrospirae bacterium]|nr:alkaline phosphatase family protein [Nitrospirota bacterium]